MNKIIFLVLAFIAVVTFVPGIANTTEAQDYAETINLYKESPQTQSFFADSYGYAVFPSIGQGGLIVGGAYGRGQVYVANQITGFAKVIKASVGLQAGGQAYSQIIFFQDKRAYDEFTTGEFAFDAQASAVVLTGGAQARAGLTGATASESGEELKTVIQAETSYYKGMAIFVRIKGGAMIEAALSGQKFSFEPL